MIVKALMTEGPYTCSWRDPLDLAARIMWQRDIGVVPVVDDRNHLVGMLTDRDIAMAAMLNGRPLRRIGVAQTMSREVFAVGPRDEVATALAVMAEHQVRRVPVVDEEHHVVGLLSINDLASASARDAKGAVVADDLAQTVAAVSRRRA